jgi:hypothetical protein
MLAHFIAKGKSFFGISARCAQGEEFPSRNFFSDVDMAVGFFHRICAHPLRLSGEAFLPPLPLESSEQIKH